MISYVNDNHGSIWHRLSHFHSVIKFLFNLGVKFKYIFNNHIFSATAKKLRKFKGCHDSACENGRSPSSIVVPFAVDTLGNFCSVAVIFLKKLAKIKFEKIPGSTEFRDLTASTWVNTTCRDIQTAIIKTCAYNNRSALKLAFGEEYDKLYPGSIYSPPSYNENFSSSEG